MNLFNNFSKKVFQNNVIKYPRFYNDHKHFILNHIRNAERILLFLDYDGTLISFQNKPNMVRTPDQVIQLIKKLNEKSSVDIIIITGRTLDDITRLINIKKINFAAVHGLHIQFSDGTQQLIEKAKKLKKIMFEIKKEAISNLTNIDGVIIEDKEFSIAFHYRMVANEYINGSKQKFYEIVNRFDDNSIEIIEGNKVLEARFKDLNKGRAVEYFVTKKNRQSNALPIYIGDDTTDEDAFKFLKKNGITFFVQNDSSLITNAKYWVKNPSEVYELLQDITIIKN